MKINQAGIEKLKAAMEAEAEFFRDYACEPSLRELAEVMLAEAEDEAHQSLQSEMSMYALAGCTMEEAAYMASLDGMVQ